MRWQLLAVEISRVGLVAKKRGYDGSVVLALDDGFDLTKVSFDWIFLEVSSSDQKVPFFLVRPPEILKSGRFSVRLEGIFSEEKASELVGRDVWMEDEVIGEVSKRGCVQGVEYLGFKVKDQTGVFLGTVVRVMPRFLQPVLEIQDSNNDVFFVPLHQDLIAESNTKTRTLIMKLPVGIFATPFRRDAVT